MCPGAQTGGMSRYGPGHLPRRPGWDYSGSGTYFVTFVVAQQHSPLCIVASGKCSLRSSGQIVTDAWNALPDVFAPARLLRLCVMPDHVHAVLRIAAPFQKPPRHSGRPSAGFFPPLGALMPRPGPELGKIIRFWKARTTRAIRVSIDPSFRWQSRYHDRVVRSEPELTRILRYLDENPSRLARRGAP